MTPKKVLRDKDFIMARTSFALKLIKKRDFNYPFMFYHWLVDISTLFFNTLNCWDLDEMIIFLRFTTSQVDIITKALSEQSITLYHDDEYRRMVTWLAKR